MPKSFHLNGDTLGFYPQTRKLKLKTVSVGSKHLRVWCWCVKRKICNLTSRGFSAFVSDKIHAKGY